MSKSAIHDLLTFIRLKDPQGYQQLRASMTPHGLGALGGDFWSELGDRLNEYAKGSVLNELDKQRFDLARQAAETQYRLDPSAAYRDATGALFGSSGIFTLPNMLILVLLVGGGFAMRRFFGKKK